jgi:hypothetical protein
MVSLSQVAPPDRCDAAGMRLLEGLVVLDNGFPALIAPWGRDVRKVRFMRYARGEILL